MCPATEKEEIRCPHCGAEPYDDDDLCRFCGKIMVPTGPAMQGREILASGIRFLKEKIRPMTAEELDEQEKSLAIFDPGNPANPIYD